jgi:excisionase family DNA binding protein
MRTKTTWKKEEKMKPENEESVAPLLLTIPQVAAVLGLGRTKVYELISLQQGGIPVIRFGRAIRISQKSLREWIQQREQEAGNRSSLL